MGYVLYVSGYVDPMSTFYLCEKEYLATERRSVNAR
jgi:hypothetical protein